MISDVDYTVTRFSQNEAGIKLASDEAISTNPLSVLTFKINTATPLSDRAARLRGIYQDQTAVCTALTAGLDGTG